MARHEFGIMPSPPEEGVRYDDYEPEKYNCISVEDEALEQILNAMRTVDFYWHTLDVPGKGLAYCGITLIPPESAAPFAKFAGGVPGLEELTALLMKAARENRFVIHYGL